MGGFRRETLIASLCLVAGTIALAPATASAARVNYRAASGAPESVFFDKGGLILRGSCISGVLGVKARSRYDNALLHANLHKQGPSVAATGDNSFDFGGANQIDVTTNLGGGDLGSTAGQLVYARPGGVNVTVDFMAEDTPSLFGSDKVCAFTGSARAAGSTNSNKVNFRSTAGPGMDNFFYSNGGLRLVQAGAASCGAVSPTIEVSARTGVENALIGEAGQYPGIGTTASLDPDFNPGLGDETGLTTPPADVNSSGHLVYARSKGRNISVDYAVHEGTGELFGSKNCAFVGTARRADSGSSHRVNFRPTGNQTLTKFFQWGGLQLWGSCNDGADPELDVVARTTHEDALLHFNGQQAPSGHAYGELDHFDTDDDPHLFVQMGGFDTSSAGQILYSRPGGVNVTVDYAASSGGVALGGTKQCAFVGTAEKNAP